MKFSKKLALADATLCNPSSHYQSSHTLKSCSALAGFFHANELILQRIKLTISFCTKLYRSSFNPQQETISHPNPDQKAWAIIIKTKSTHHVQSLAQACPLTGQTILCVGGYRRLYPDYQTIISDVGGIFLPFHGDSDESLNKLPHLLEEADMIICAADRVDHEAFFWVRCYCKHSRKTCVLLDHSKLDTFKQGVQKLAQLAEHKQSVK